jgi:hypothetical protein
VIVTHIRVRIPLGPPPMLTRDSNARELLERINRLLAQGSPAADANAFRPALRLSDVVARARHIAGAGGEPLARSCRLASRIRTASATSRRASARIASAANWLASKACLSIESSLRKQAPRERQKGVGSLS